MTPKKILEVVKIYIDNLDRIEVKSVKHSHVEPLESEEAGLSHVRAMLNDIAQFVKEGRIEKAFR